MRKLKLIISLFMILSLFACVSSSFAQDYLDKSEKYEGGIRAKFFFKVDFILKNAKDIKINVDQEENMKKLVLKLKKFIILKEAEIETLYMDIDSELKKDTLYINAINSFIDKKYEVQKQKEKASVEAYVALDEMLDRDQKNRVKELMLLNSQKDKQNNMKD